MAAVVLQPPRSLHISDSAQDLVGKFILERQAVKQALPASVAPASAQQLQYQASTTGAPNSFDFRMRCSYEGGLVQGSTLISYWHSIPLFAGKGLFHMVCEVPKNTSAKFEVCLHELHTPIKQDIKKGQLRHYAMDICWNYGMLPQTWEDPDHANEHLSGIKGDNDPLDVVEIGSATMSCGAVYTVKPLGVYAMIDDGELDWKVIVIRSDDPLAERMNDVADVEREMPGELARVLEWFRSYKIPDGKPANKFGFDEKVLNKEFALAVIAETHRFYTDLKSGQHFPRHKELAMF